MVEWDVIVIFAVFVSIYLYCCYKDFTNDRREKEAIKKALKDAGYV